jgi:hypothetical protein
MTKATAAAGDQMKHGPNWALSRRAILKVFDDRLECGDWKVPFSEISEAKLYSIRSTLFIPGYVLQIQTHEQAYHFGLNWGSFWTKELPFPVKRERGKLGACRTYPARLRKSGIRPKFPLVFVICVHTNSSNS